jgi:hypothetical protein
MVGLALLDAAVSSQAAANRTGSLMTGVATVIQHILSPTVAAIPDLRTHGGAVTTSATSSATTAEPATDTTSTDTSSAEWTTSASAPTDPSQLET